ncbi:MAG: quinone-dependent dihydroorotate dehydrogenase, partial [Betaproteobacteria bacterium]|nr:quinone-dependent dihydroorotate dehydrogenase [Betaproteobacteria bacterium]
MNLYRWCVRPILFGFDPERVHEATLSACRTLGRSGFVLRGLHSVFGCEDARLRVSVAGMEFPNPLGLGAGLDKNARAAEALAALGFGFLELGSVSARPSAGNRVRPRLFRLPADEALVVFYGVPNEGAAAIAHRLAAVRRTVPLGVSLVETNTGTMGEVEHVIEELVDAARPFLGLADYLTLNLNCPNSTDGRSHFEDPRNLRLLLERLQSIEPLPPVFVKTASPAEPGAIDAVLEACDPFGFVKGFIPSAHAENCRARLKTPQEALERMSGSVTGPVNRQAAHEAVRSWYARIDRRRHVLVGVGGITCAEDAYEFIRSGAALVQLVTALVYRGPGLVKRIKQRLCGLIERDGLGNVAEAVG